MQSLFSINSKFYHYLGKFTDCILLSLFWIICCLPIFTIGASSTALYYTSNKAVRHDRGHVWKEFTTAFRVNFKQATLLWLPFMLIAIITATDFFILRNMIANSEAASGFVPVFVVLFLCEIGISIYLFPYIARFEGSNLEILKKSAAIAFGNLLWTLLLLFLFALCVLIFWIFPLSILLLPTLFSLCSGIIIERIFRKYMAEDDLREEDELNSCDRE